MWAGEDCNAAHLDRAAADTAAGSILKKYAALTGPRGLNPRREIAEVSCPSVSSIRMCRSTVKIARACDVASNWSGGSSHRFPAWPTRQALRHVHSLLQPALAVREIFIAGIFSELGLEGGDDSSGVFPGAPVGASA